MKSGGARASNKSKLCIERRPDCRPQTSKDASSSPWHRREPPLGTVSARYFPKCEPKDAQGLIWGRRVTCWRERATKRPFGLPRERQLKSQLQDDVKTTIPRPPRRGCCREPPRCRETTGPSAREAINPSRTEHRSTVNDHPSAPWRRRDPVRSQKQHTFGKAPKVPARPPPPHYPAETTRNPHGRSAFQKFDYSWCSRNRPGLEF